jgi:hypothetical protein
MKLEDLAGKELYEALIEIRDNSDIYEEVVLLKKDLPGWNKALSEKLGPPLISTEEYDILNASEDVLASKIDLALESANSFGGIDEGQTLYHGVYDSTVVLIMIWPWQDNVKVTLKKAIV